MLQLLYFRYAVYSQIWFNCLMDDGHFSSCYITKSEKKKHTRYICPHWWRERRSPKKKGWSNGFFPNPDPKKKKRQTIIIFKKKKKKGLPLFMRLEWYSDHFKERRICSPFKRAKETQLLITLVLRIIWCKWESTLQFLCNTWMIRMAHISAMKTHKAYYFIFNFWKNP